MRACLAFVFLPLAAASASAEVTFERDVRPILKVHCFGCHGEAKELAGGLDLRLGRLIVRGGDSGEAVAVGKSGESLLIDYVRSGEMPPGEELRLAEDDVEVLAKWIDGGAVVSGVEPEADPAPGEILITDVERSHWAYRAIQKPQVPNVAGLGEDANPIDAFVARRLEENGLLFSGEAQRRTLIRRATFDLLGLPPTPEEVDAFVNEESPQAYATLIDRLLESPHYGERWARHWLDAAGYADSEGYNDKDVIRDDAWRYRDYVIRSLNADKPWDQFIIEQLAGDELVGATHANAQGLANADPAALEALTATGFLRMAPDGSGSSPADPLAARNQAVTETLKVVSTSLLGTSLACAECHHHRFDPIPQEDFYRVRAIFAPVFDLKNWRMPKSRRAAILSESDKKKADEIEAQAKTLAAEHDRLKQETLELILERVLEGIPAERREFAREAFATPKDKRTEEQRLFCEEEFPMLGLLRTGTLHLFLARFKDGEELKKKYEDVLAEAAKVRKDKPTPDYIRVATEDTKSVPETKLFFRGDFSSPQGEPLEPAGLTVLDGFRESALPANDEALPTTGRRLAYARYLTSGNHPLVARVLVNRFWQHHFGRGLVETTGEFGRQGGEPSHGELLDWLAADFMEHGWQLKRLHRLIMTSRTYRQASQRRPEADAIDAENRLLWRMPVRRLEAEALRDAILAVSGQLNREAFGLPVPVSVTEGGIVSVNGGTVSEDRRELKRSIYIQVRRSQPVAMLDAFDSPQMEPNCARRVVSTVAPQSLALLNSDFVLQQAESLAGRVAAESTAESVTQLWRLTYGRHPTDNELQSAESFLQSQTQDLTAEKVDKPQRAALASLGQVLLGSNEFLYVD
ncbi:MAG: PSD1 and planctomycete cytochrome C domain-containing protein [Planctomycetota bacterium]